MIGDGDGFRIIKPERALQGFVFFAFKVAGKEAVRALPATQSERLEVVVELGQAADDDHIALELQVILHLCLRCLSDRRLGTQRESCRRQTGDG